MKNLFTLSLLLLASSAVAMEPAASASAAPVAKEAMAKAAEVAKETAKAVIENASKAIEAVADAAKNVAAKAQEAVKPACKNKGIAHSVEHMFKDGVNFANAQLAQVSKTYNTLKLNGWNALNKNEKIGVVVAGSAVVAASAYVVYKLYKVATKVDKNSQVRVNVRQVRA